MSEAQTTHMKSVQFARQAAQLISEGTVDEARDLLSEGTSSQERYSAGFQILGDLFIHEGDTTQAVEQYERALALDPQNPRLLLSLGKLMLDEQPERAQDLFWRALRYEPDVPELDAAMKEAIMRMEGTDVEASPEEPTEEIPGEEIIIEDEDALAALTEQPEELQAEPETLATLDEESTAELEIVDMPDEAEADSAATSERDTAVHDNIQYTRTDDDLDLSDMTKAALADLDQPVATGQTREDVDTFTDIGDITTLTGEQGDEELSGELPEDNMVSETEGVTIEATEQSEDLSMLAADIDLTETEAEPETHPDSAPEDIAEPVSDASVAIEEAALPETEEQTQAPVTTDEEMSEDNVPEEPDAITDVDDIMAGLEEDDSDISFLVGGDQQETNATDQPVESADEETILLDEETPESSAQEQETAIVEEETEIDLAEQTIEDFTGDTESIIPEEPDEQEEREIPIFEPDEGSATPEPEPEPDEQEELKPTDSIEIGPDALFGESIDIGPDTMPEDFLDVIPDTPAEPEAETSATASIDELAIEQAAVPEELSDDSETRSEPVEEAEEPLSYEMEPAITDESMGDALSEVELADHDIITIEPEIPAAESIAEQAEALPSTDYSALLAGMDLSDIEEESGMVGGILELGEEDLSGLEFNESTPESVEEPVISDEERAELSALEMLIEEDEQPISTETDISFDAIMHEEEPKSTKTDYDVSSGIDYSDILSEATEELSETPELSTDLSTEEITTESPEMVIEEPISTSTDTAEVESDGGYEDMLAELAGPSTMAPSDEHETTADQNIISQIMSDTPVEQPAEIIDESDIEISDVSIEPSEPEPVELTSYSDEGDIDTTEQDTGTVEDLMKGTMSIRLDLSGEDAAAVDDSSLDSLISDYMSALDTYSGTEKAIEPIREDTRPDSPEPETTTTEHSDAEQDNLADISATSEKADISVEEFGADADGPVGPEEATATIAEIFAKQGLYLRAIDIYTNILNRDPENESARSRLEELKQLHDNASDGR